MFQLSYTVGGSFRWRSDALRHPTAAAIRCVKIFPDVFLSEDGLGVVPKLVFYVSSSIRLVIPPSFQDIGSHAVGASGSSLASTVLHQYLLPVRQDIGAVLER